MKYRPTNSNFGHAIFMAFSFEARQTSQGRGVASMNEFPCRTLAKRIKLDRENRLPGQVPSHSNCIAYVPGKINKTSLFVNVFPTLGVTR